MLNGITISGAIIGKIIKDFLGAAEVDVTLGIPQQLNGS